MPTMQRIEICGNIASGKTTLVTTLSRVGFNPVNEDFKQNPFLEKFYQNPQLYSFETEITFILQHYHQIKNSQNIKTICDFSLTLDKSYADVTLKERKLAIFLDLASEIEFEIDNPAKIIYLHCPIDELLLRIQRRKRHFESNITAEYLTLISAAIEKRIAEISCHVEVITIDSSKHDFRNTVAGIPVLASLKL